MQICRYTIINFDPNLDLDPNLVLQKILIRQLQKVLHIGAARFFLLGTIILFICLFKFHENFINGLLKFKPKKFKFIMY